MLDLDNLGEKSPRRKWQEKKLIIYHAQNILYKKKKSLKRWAHNLNDNVWYNSKPRIIFHSFTLAFHDNNFLNMWINKIEKLQSIYACNKYSVICVTGIISTDNKQTLIDCPLHAEINKYILYLILFTPYFSCLYFYFSVIFLLI